VTGVDVEPDFLAEFARRIARQGWAPRVAATALQEGRIPLPDRCADVVTCFAVLEHVPQEMAALAEMHRVLRPSGRLVISVPNRWWIFETHGADLPLLPWNRVPLVSWWPKRLHDRWARARIYRRRELLAILETAGFTVTEVVRLTAPMDMLPGESLRRLARRTLFAPDRTPIPFLATEILAAATR
jgi:ubiquinone/menaquinone biosynthesis C-methylase UbiE